MSRWIGLTAVMLAVCPSLFAEDAYQLRYRFSPDEVLRYEVDHETMMITTRPELTERVKNEVHSEKAHRVVSVDGQGTATLETTIENTRMSAFFGDSAPIKFDSRKPEDCPRYYRDVKSMVGKPLARFRVSAEGELLSMKSLQRIAQTNPDSTADASQNFLIKFPEEAVSVGKGWTETYQVKVNVSRTLKQNVTMQRRYDLVSLEDGIATIKLRTMLITPIRDASVLVQLIQMTPSGTIEFDIKQGRMLSRKLLVDKTEVGVIGGNSTMRAKSTRTEKLIVSKEVASAD